MANIANNHFFRRKWSMDLFNSTILSDIWPEVLFFSAFATMVTLVTELTPHNLAVSNQLLTVAGVVLALVISFRTSSANERFQDGAKMWTNIRTSSRTLAQQFWLHVADEREVEGNQVPVLEVIMEKKTMINLIYAFSVSIKHLLRDEPGVFYEDLYPNIAFLPKYATEKADAADILPLWHIRGGRRMNPKAAQRKDTLLSLVRLDDPPLKPACMPPRTTIYDYFGILRLGRFAIRKLLKKANLRSEGPPKHIKKRIAYSEVVESTVPLELHLILSNYAAFLMQSNLIGIPMAAGMYSTLAALHDSFAQLDRICNNPLPFAYQAHLRMCLWLYLLLLPFQLVEGFDYMTIPATAFVAFLLIGFLEIGQEIENPFNYGLNDLDLDSYCDTIRRDLHEITTHPLWTPSDIVFDNRNQPFAPVDRRGAKDLVAALDGEFHPANPQDKHGVEGICHLLVRNWREVDFLTRKMS